MNAYAKASPMQPPLDDDPPNLDLLIKLLKMTTSLQDNEALIAVRMANAALKKFGGDWDNLLRGRVTIIADPFANGGIPPIDRPVRHAAPPPPPSRPAPRPTPPPTPQR